MRAQSFIRSLGKNRYALLGFLLGFLFLSFRLFFFIEMDQAIHEYIGWRLTKGELPYIGGYDQNLPGGDILHAISILLFGTSSLGFALFDLLVQSLALYLILRLLREFEAPSLALIMGPLFYAWIYVGLDSWHSGQRDGFAVPLMLLVLLLALRLSSKPAFRTAIGLGLTIGFMVLIRPLLGLVVIPISGLLLYQHRKAAFPSILQIGIASAIPLVLVTIVYLSTGNGEEFYNAVVRFNLEVYAKFQEGATYRGSGQMTIPILTGVLLLLLAPKRWRIRLCFLVLCAFVAPTSTFLQGQGDAHHMLPTYGILSVLGAAGYGFALAKVEWHSVRIALAVLIIGLTSWRGVVRTPTHLLKLYLRTHSLREVYAAQEAGAIRPYAEEHAAEYIRDHTATDDAIQIWGMRTRIHTLAMRRAASRFFTDQHLLMQPHGQPLTALQLQWRAEYLNSLRRERPVYIIVCTTDNLWLLPEGESSREQLKRFPQFEEYLHQNYHAENLIGGFELWRRNRD